MGKAHKTPPHLPIATRNPKDPRYLKWDEKRATHKESPINLFKRICSAPVVASAVIVVALTTAVVSTAAGFVGLVVFDSFFKRPAFEYGFA